MSIESEGWVSGPRGSSAFLSFLIRSYFPSENARVLITRPQAFSFLLNSLLRRCCFLIGIETSPKQHALTSQPLTVVFAGNWPNASVQKLYKLFRTPATAIGTVTAAIAGIAASAATPTTRRWCQAWGLQFRVPAGYYSELHLAQVLEADPQTVNSSKLKPTWKGLQARSAQVLNIVILRGFVALYPQSLGTRGKGARFLI